MAAAQRAADAAGAICFQTHGIASSPLDVSRMGLAWAGLLSCRQQRGVCDDARLQWPRRLDIEIALKFHGNI